MGASGCAVTTATTPLQLRCNCNHLTAFGGSVSVAENPITYRAITADDLAANPVVLIVLCGAWIVYAIATLLAVRADRQEMCHPGPVNVPSNDERHHGSYEIVVKTGTATSTLFWTMFL